VVKALKVFKAVLVVKVQ
jgi:hypothetical protein